MPVGELFLSAFISVLFEKLTSSELLQYATQEGIKSKLANWERKFTMIRAVLSGLEENPFHPMDSVSEKWLDDLRDLVYDAEDILDKFATDALGRKLMAERHPLIGRVQNCTPDCFTGLTPHTIKFHASMRSKIKGIDSRLEDLYGRINFLASIRTGFGGPSDDASPTPTNTNTWVAIEPAIYGRDDDKAKILEIVLRDEPSDGKFHIISIVGMGGIGKTTLAWEVYSDKAVEVFNLKAWVLISHDFDVLRIFKAILESITSESCNVETLDRAHGKLKDKLSGKRFLLVLDNVWNKDCDKWKYLKSAFTVGAPGSRIIVTTRDLEVVSTITGSTECHSLKPLSDDDCWSIFTNHAFQIRDIGAVSNLNWIHEKVIAKCGGLPLVATILGGLLFSKQRDAEWEDILSKNWNALDVGDKILLALKLSYSHLPSYIKRCFSYCAILPKNFEFTEKQLVLLWMSENLIQPFDNKPLEEVGGMYFRELVSRSMFQRSTRDGSKFVMHDLINDLAQQVSGKTCFRLTDELVTENILGIRHSSYVSGIYDDRKKFEVLHKVKHLRTFLPVRLFEDGTRYITSLFLYDLMPKLKKLRVLSLATYYITKLPDSIGGLRHLRYLNLSQTKIRILPESTCLLYNLQILSLADCDSLLKLPSKMRNLINLRHLDISGANLIRKMPLGMKDLTCLQTLSNFIVGKGNGSGLEDLKCLKDLHEKLCVSKLENSQDPTMFILIDMRHLKVLVLEWSPQLDHPQDIAVEEKVLEWLQPHEELEELTIRCYGGTKFPPWFGNPYFNSKLRVLRLENCKNCTSLPALCLFGQLEELIIKNMTGIRSIGSEIYGKSLVNLHFEGLEEWEHWNLTDVTDPVERFPHLQKLSMINCPKLSGARLNHLQSLEKLIVFNCAQLVTSFLSLPKLCELVIDGCKKMDSNSLTDSKSLKSLTLSDFSGFENWLRQEPSIHTSLHELCIHNFKVLTSLPEGLKTFSHLECLEIKGCDSLTSFVIDQLPSSLKRFSVLNCENLQSLFPGEEGPSSSASHESKLEYLSISNCASLKCILLEERSFSALTFLEMWNCAKLTSISTRGELPAAVKRLQIRNCSELTTLVGDKLPETLEYLLIDRCSKLESMAGRFHNNQSLRFIRLSNCKKIQSLPDGLHNLSSLQGIDIYDCPSLVGLPQGGLPTSISNISICRCVKLEALHSSINNLNSLQELTIHECPSMSSFPAEGFPINLTSLSIEDQNILASSLLEWGLPRLRCLKHLSIAGCSDAVSFPAERLLLPASLTVLEIQNFQKLKHLSSQLFQSLTALEHLVIGDCPYLSSLPKEGLPSSLLQLRIFGCYMLAKQCKMDKGKEWSKIVHIPCVEIDHKFIYEE